MTGIDHMTAGPELDRMIAERVMGWTYCGVRERTPGQGGPCDFYADDQGRYLWFMPSKYIDHAWQISEQMKSRGYRFVIANCSHYDGLIYCDFTNDDSRFSMAKAPTAPLAICRAALKAVVA